MEVSLSPVKEQNRLNAFEKAFLAFLGTGFSPLAPGTMGSLATIPLLYVFGYFKLHVIIVLTITLALTLAAIKVTERVQNRIGVFDPGWIVIDEVIGMILTWCFVMSTNPKDLLLVFLTFRFFDIIKIWPASLVDKKLKSGAGTIIDDLVSAIYAGLLCLILKKFSFGLA